jgi:hypothetical protein
MRQIKGWTCHTAYQRETGPTSQESIKDKYCRVCPPTRDCSLGGNWFPRTDFLAEVTAVRHAIEISYETSAVVTRTRLNRSVSSSRLFPTLEPVRCKPHGHSLIKSSKSNLVVSLEIVYTISRFLTKKFLTHPVKHLRSVSPNGSCRRHAQ